MNKFAIINFLSKNKQYFKFTLKYYRKIAEHPNMVNFFSIILKKNFMEFI